MTTKNNYELQNVYYTIISHLKKTKLADFHPFMTFEWLLFGHDTISSL